MESNPRSESLATPHLQHGVTLIELLVVLAILSVVLGLSMAVFKRTSRANQLPAAASRVTSIIRSARNYSLTSGLPSKVLVEVGTDTLPARVSGFGYEQVAGWHFEDRQELGSVNAGDRVRGAFNVNAEIQGNGLSVVRGKIGNALEFPADATGAALIAEPLPRFHSPRGFSLEAWILFEQPILTDDMIRRRARAKKGSWVDPRRNDAFAVISKQGSYEMGVLGDGSVYVVVGDEDGESRQVETDAGVVVGLRWTHLRASYDGVDVTVEIDGMRRPWFPQGFRNIYFDDWPQPLFPAEIPASPNSYLTVSRPDRIFLGLIDEVKVRMALQPQTYELPNDIEFREPQRDFTLQFDGRGALDPSVHTQGVRLLLVALGDDLDEETPTPRPGSTAVMAEEAGGGAAVEITDPLQALMKHMEEEQAKERDAKGEGGAEDGSVDGSGVDSPAEEDPSRTPEGARQGRTAEIFIDLTGAVRG